MKKVTAKKLGYKKLTIIKLVVLLRANLVHSIKSQMTILLNSNRFYLTTVTANELGW